MFSGDAYLGNSLVSDRVVIEDQNEIKNLLENPDYEDYRRKHPNFEKALTDQITAPHTQKELKTYGEFIESFHKIAKRYNGELTDHKARDIVSLVYKFHKRNFHSKRKIDSGIVGRDKSLPEDYVFYVANAYTACGTASEATIALLRSAGFRARLVVLAHRPDRIQADHVLAEYFSHELKRWVMVDPIVNYLGQQSVLNILSDTKVSESLNQRHTDLHYKPKTTAIIDRRGLHRKIFYYSPSSVSRQTTRNTLAQN
ncbi:MAG: hypothetical protein CMM52_05380 [Rhodospirillaceae bacterium]|nr:hypothetical protein [Rhodospirillaceae bacterium]|tara:strand:+ start:41040 stop:41807 length:768 start_codon:yes stop_codon:yes gene_type:complete